MSAKNICANSWARVAVSLAALIAWTGGVNAQLPLPVSTQFDITGFLQAATLDNAVDLRSGGTLQVNGHRIVVPAQTIVILPANALTWQELFAQAPAPYGLPAVTGTVAMTGMAAGDTPAPLTTYEVQVVGNRVVNGTGGCPASVSAVNDCYIAGLVFVSQQGLNNGAGFINWIDYTNGELRVGGDLGVSTSGTRVRLNDPIAHDLAGNQILDRLGVPTGRYGRANTADQRFMVDQDNPTIKSETGFPMCLPRWDPAGVNGDDPLCTQKNRPAGQISIQMNDPAFVDANVGANLTDPRIQAPFEMGDYISFAGTLMQDAVPASPTAGPYPAAGAASTYVAAHTITNNIAIYTWPGTNPAYVSTDVTLIGTGGLTVLGAGEATIRTRFEGMMTDTSRRIHLYGIDIDPRTGLTTDRDWGLVGVDPGPAGLGAVKGRWRFRPPCLPFGSNPTKPDKSCVMNAAGSFLPVTREMRAVVEAIPGSLLAPPEGAVGGVGGGGPVPNGWVTGQVTTYANGIIAGQYHAPIMEYIFPENIPGTPIVENNFEDVPFLAQGGYTTSTGTMAFGRLTPWPGDPSTAPVPTFTPASIPLTVTMSAAMPNTVNAGATINVSAAASGGTAPYTWAWSSSTNPATGTTNGTYANALVSSTTWTAKATVAAGTQDVLKVSVTDANGTVVSATSPLTIALATAPWMDGVAPVTVVTATQNNRINVTAYTLDAKAGGKLTIAVIKQPFAAAANQVTFNGQAITCSPTAVPPAVPGGALRSGCKNTTTFNFNAQTLAVAQPAVSGALSFKATDSNLSPVQASGEELTSLTVRPIPDVVLVTSTEYRQGKERLIINATSSVSPAVNLTLQPYLTSSGLIYDPDPAAGGLGNVLTWTPATPLAPAAWIIDLVGAPKPVCNAVGEAVYAAPCSQTPLVITSNLGGVSLPTNMQMIRQ